MKTWTHGSRRRTVRRAAPVGLVGIMAMGGGLGGCAEKLLRENVFANTETMFGIMVTENPKTQLYEGRVGYARHELFLVPTSKRVHYSEGETGDPGTGTHDDPSKTPEVLAEIQVGGHAKGGGTVKVYQRLAVGALAVRSGAAIALMAQNVETARAAAIGAIPADTLRAPLTGDRAMMREQLNQLAEQAIALDTLMVEDERGDLAPMKWHDAFDVLAKRTTGLSKDDVELDANDEQLAAYIEAIQHAIATTEQE